MKFDPRKRWRYPVPHEPPPCLVEGKGSEPAAVSLLRQLGLEVHWVTKAPSGSPWVVKADWLRGETPVEKALSAWRSTSAIPWRLEQRQWAHLRSSGWTTQDGPGKRLSAWDYPADQENGGERAQSVLLLAQDWEDLNPWLDFAAQAGISLLAAIDPKELATIEEYTDVCAIVAHPAIVNQSRWAWLFSSRRWPGLVAAPMDLIHPEAFSNLVKHALWRAQIAKEQAAYRAALCSRETPLLAQAASADLERAAKAPDLRKEALQVVGRLRSHLQQNLRWHLKIQWDGSWSLASSEHCWRWSRHHQRLSYQEEPGLGDIHFSSLWFRGMGKPVGFTYYPWGFLPPSHFELECEGELVEHSEQEIVFDSLAPTPPSPLLSLSLVRTPPAVGFLNFGSKPVQITKGWGLQDQADALTIHLEVDQLFPRNQTLRDLPRVLMLVSEAADQVHAVKLLEQCSQIIVILKRLEKTGLMAGMLEPDWIFCDPVLLESDLEANLARRAWWGSRISGARSATLPGNWRLGTHLRDFLDQTVIQPRPKPATRASQKKIESVIGQLQQSLEQSECCHLRFLVNGGWQASLEASPAHNWTKANYSWSPAETSLRGEIFSSEGKVVRHQADHLKNSYTEAQSPELHISFSALVPDKPFVGELEFGVSRRFAAAPQKTSSGWRFTTLEA